MPKASKREGVKYWTKKLDTVFSQYIRLRDVDKTGYGFCISSGKKVAYWESDCGHFINRRWKSTRFDEKNCNLQSRFDNRFDEGNILGYSKGIKKKWGESIVNILELKKRSSKKFMAYELKALFDHYTKEVERLKIEKEWDNWKRPKKLKKK